MKNIYDNLPQQFQSEKFITNLEDAISKSKQDNWRGNPLKEKIIKMSIQNVTKDEIVSDKIIELLRNQYDY